MTKQDIQQECRKIFDEIRQLQNALDWSDTKLYNVTFVEIYDDETGNETDNQRKFKAKTKKRFQRKSWDSGNATQQTLLELKKIRDAIYCCNDYKESELFESDIPLDIRQHIQKESEKLEDYLRSKDCEN